MRGNGERPQNQGFRILGRVEVEVEVEGGGEIGEVRGGKCRALVVALLLQVNRIVALDRITEALWADLPPLSATANIRTHAWNLRRQLPTVARLRSRAGGYQLAVPPERCDHLRFAQLVGAGRSALAAGDAVRAAELLSDGLDLWQGDRAAVGVPRYGPLEGWLDHLDDERVRAVEDLAEAYLRLGEARAALRELKAPLGMTRLRTRNCLLRMRAHRQLGEPARALDVYRDAEKALREELGIEPDEQLRAFYQEITEG